MSIAAWIFVGVVAYADIVLFAMALCRAAKNGDHQSGCEQ